MNIADKNVVYIGGSGGIGSAVCKLCALKKVANLAILDLVECADLIEEIKVLNPSTNAFFMKIDIRCKTEIRERLNEVVARLGEIHLLINGSGLFNDNDAELTIGINLLGIINSTMIAMDLMDTSKGGLIVNIASVAGLSPISTSPIYCASKAGIIIFTRSMAEQSFLKQSGISLITICPGMTKTGLLDQFTSEANSSFAEIIKKTFSGIKKQTPEECAQSIIKAIETNDKNGAVYMCDLGELKEVTFPEYWVPKHLDLE